MSLSCLVILLVGFGAVDSSAQTLPFTEPSWSLGTRFPTANRVVALSDAGTTGAVFRFAIEGKTLYGAIAANVDGYVGVGLNDNGPGMPGADMIVCRNGPASLDSPASSSSSSSQPLPFEIQAYDMHAPRLGAPVLDSVQDVVTISAGRTSGVTYCEFRRTLETCDDPRMDFQITDLSLSINVLLAWRSGDDLNYHGSGQRRTYPFAFDQGSAPPLPTNVQSFTVSAPSHPVSPDGGSYACSFHRMPVSAATKFHIVQYEVDRAGPAVDAGVLHHVNLYKCPSDIPSLANGAAVPCEVLMAACNEVILSAGYTPGGTYMPANAGIPLGNDGLMYGAISRHFYNPAGKTGLSDNGTKYTVRYTSTLRQNELAQIALGTTAFEVPPHTFGHTISSLCSPDCTQRLGTNGVQVVGVNFHMHGYGKIARARVVRGGQELAPLAVADPFDVSQVNFATNRQILPGDAIWLDCVYDNDTPYTLTYGDNITQEMCFAFLTVIGQSRIRSCLDLPWGVTFSQTVRDQCAPYVGTVPDCNETAARSYCPDITNSQLPLAILNGDARRASYSDYVPSSNCQPPTGCVSTPVQGAPGECGPGPISGSVDSPLGSIFDFSVSWVTDCSANEVQFKMRARTSGWLGMGLHDAGTLANPIALPTTRMLQADIVQGRTVNAGIRDSKGRSGYDIPVVKAASVATFVSASYNAGYSEVVFKRSFVSRDGVNVTADRFVYVVMALSDSNDFDVKHHTAGAVLVPVSFFGGKPSSSRIECVPSSASASTTVSSTGSPVSTTDGAAAEASTARPRLNTGVALIVALVLLFFALC